MSFQTLKVKEEKGLFEVSLDRPESFNAMNTALVDELHALFLQLERNSDCRAVLLTGEGKAFCSGGDVKSFFKAFEDQNASSLFHQLPTRAVAVGKRLIFESLNTPMETQLYRETEGVKQTAMSKDFFEGVRAFVEKRSPKFKGE